jgi:cholesterol oxidase
MTYRLSEPVERLIDEADANPVTVDVLIVGSGYGGAVAAMRLAHTGKVYVLERGREYGIGDFPLGLGDIPGSVQFRRPEDEDGIGYADGLFDFRFGDNVDIVLGSGLGGTSLINANVAALPDASVFQHVRWPEVIRSEIADGNSALNTAFAELEQHLDLSAVRETDKYRALKRLSDSLEEPDTHCKPARITVTLKQADSSDPKNRNAGDNPAYSNAVGVRQAPCTLCGNCVSGCNVGAKNTLAMNLIPLAKTRGARFFTGATVLRLEHVGKAAQHPWRVHFRRTVSAKTPLAGETYSIGATRVILAAGTLGSTEILKRSEAYDEKFGDGSSKLQFSSCLGERFSTNGDTLVAGYGQASPVNALGKANPLDKHDVGPTICGICTTTVQDPVTGAPMRLTIEDGAVPAGLVSVFGELATTAAQVQRLASDKLPAWLRQKDENGRTPDPVAVHPTALERSQLLLIMGDDGAGGSLELTPATDPTPLALDRTRVKVVWDDAAENPALRCADHLLSTQDCKAGFDGGQYVPYPLWRLLPAEAAQVMSGGAPRRRVITVHPMGGCPMGEDARCGVVDHAGRVFARDAASGFYGGLYVLDGSILPTALGINPFLTIAALAWRACGIMLQGRQAAASQDKVCATLDDLGIPPAGRQLLSVVPDERVAVSLFEQMLGSLKCSASELDEFIPGAARWADFNGFVLRTSMRIADMAQWLSDPGAQPLDAKAEIYANPLSAKYMRQHRSFHVPWDHLKGEEPLLRAEGTVRLLERDLATGLERWGRIIRALIAYSRRRQSLFSYARERAAPWLVPQDRSAATEAGTRTSGSFWESIRKLWKSISGFLFIAKMHADYRTMQYEFRGEQGDCEVQISGTKRLAWALGNPQVWDALLRLPVVIRFRLGARAIEARGLLVLDTDEMAGAGLPQVEHSPYLPASVARLGGFGMFFARAILQTSFWEFGVNDYPKNPVQLRPDPRPLKVGGKVVAPETLRLRVPLSHKDTRTVPISLTRYRQVDREKSAPVLLVHGLAQGNLIYSTDTMRKNMAAYMWEQGYDVWLLDYRISNVHIAAVPEGGWSMEEIARYDIPAAFEHVYRASGGQPLRVFAHCVGATVITMAVLKGWLPSKLLAKAAFNAIHPWIYYSPVNRSRAALGTLFRDAMGRDLLDPVPRPDPGPTQVLLDRLGFSLSRYEEERADRHRPDNTWALAQGTCDRMSFLYARMWRHANLDSRTHADFPNIVGPAPGDVYRHLYYFSRRERVTDRDGQNLFLIEQNLRDRWTFPTMFFHGEVSQVFNAQSATESAVRLAWVRSRATGLPFSDAAKNIWLRRVPDYGHMDIVFGKRAYVDVYPCLRDFFEYDPNNTPAITCSDSYLPEDGRHADVRQRFPAGPILRAAWIANRRIQLRFWAEIDEGSTTLIRGVKLDSSDAHVVREWRIRACERYYRLVDVEIDIDGGDIRMRLLPDADTGGVSGTKPPDGSGACDVIVSKDLTWITRLRERAAEKQVQEFSFLAGSCRYPGTAFERDASDAVFEGMLRHVRGEQEEAGVDLVFLIGDQIYADATANMLDSQSWRERYSLRYREAFTSTHLRQLLKTVPAHFAVDDHEFSDNWSGLPRIHGPLPRDRSAVRRHWLGRRAARSYQSSGRETRPIPDGTGRTRALWYPLSHDCEVVYPAFVMDTRSERELRVAGMAGYAARITGATQWRALEQWLLQVHRDRPDAPKFLFSGSVVAPIARDFARHESLWRCEDGWAGYPGSLGRLIEAIVSKGIRNVVFVGGDLHFSAAGRLDLKWNGHPPVTAWQIVSSGLYAPMPFANNQPGSYDWNTPYPIHVPHSNAAVTANMGLLCTGVQNFVRVDVRSANGSLEMRVRANDAAGAGIQPVTAPPDGVRLEGASWVISLQ